MTRRVFGFCPDCQRDDTEKNVLVELSGEQEDERFFDDHVDACTCSRPILIGEDELRWLVEEAKKRGIA